jgi:hypothetical protein
MISSKVNPQGRHGKMQPRPFSLAAIARESSALGNFGRYVRDFLHGWNRAKREGKDLAPRGSSSLAGMR